jgi:O-antigen ligase
MVTKLSLCLLAFIPLVVDLNVFYPYTGGKNLLIEACLVLVGILLLINLFYSRVFREEIIDKATRYIRNPLVLAVLAFVSVSFVSTIFAVDKYLAFWGELIRAEGFVGLIFFFSFFVFTLLTFEKSDWLWFFKLSLFVSLILIGKEFTEFFQGVIRPGSYTGNPIFLAGYLLFSITSGLIVLSNQSSALLARPKPSVEGNLQKGSALVSKGFWFFLSLATIILSIAGIFITQTRGTLLGFGLGILAVFVYSIVKGKNINYKNINLRRVSIVFLILGIILSGVFVLLRKNDVWQRVPGFSRLAVIGDGSVADASTNVRLFIYKSGLMSVNPLTNGWKKAIIGWGPENFVVAGSQYYFIEQYKYEEKWYDRSHNKLLDVLVMTGIFGLLAYLAIWFLFFRFLWKKSTRTEGFRVIDMALLFWSVSFFIHLMFAFDVISTSIPFFAILAFIVYLSIENKVLNEPKRILKDVESKEKKQILAITPLIILTIFCAFVFLKNTLPGYIQMRDYTYQIKNPKAIDFETKIESAFTPITTVQTNIRSDFLKNAKNLYDQNSNDLSLKLLEKSIIKAEEYMVSRSIDFRFMTILADFYTNQGRVLDNMEYLKRGEELFEQVQIFVPNRPDIKRSFAVNIFYQKRYLESFVLFEELFDLIPDYFNYNKKAIEIIYTRFIQYFYEQKDKENFVVVANRLKENNYAGTENLDKILDYLNKSGVWPNVAFE